VIRRGHQPSGPQTNLALSNRLNYLKVDYAGQYRQELALLGGAVNPRTWFIKSRVTPLSCAKWRGTRCESPVPFENFEGNTKYRRQPPHSPYPPRRLPSRSRGKAVRASDRPIDHAARRRCDRSGCARSRGPTFLPPFIEQRCQRLRPLDCGLLCLAAIGPQPAMAEYECCRSGRAGHPGAGAVTGTRRINLPRTPLY
jgi:hypothetical protein